MKKKIIFALDVSDLTLARYYSAMSVNFLIVNLDERPWEKNIELIKELKAWVEGPHLLACSSDLDKINFYKNNNPGFDEFLTRSELLQCHSIITNQVASIIMSAFPEIHLNEYKYSNINFVRKGLDIDEKNPSNIYCIFSDTEATTGIFDFDDLDLIFEKINV